MKLYCNKCYAKSEYKFSKPKFCPECGEKVSSLGSLAASELKPKKENQKAFINKQNISNEDEIENYENPGQEHEEDYETVQEHIEKFKKNKNKSAGVIVEKPVGNTGISFGQLMQSPSSGSGGSSDFKRLSLDSNSGKTKKQILEELRAESSSEARVINID